MRNSLLPLLVLLALTGCTRPNDTTTEPADTTPAPSVDMGHAVVGADMTDVAQLGDMAEAVTTGGDLAQPAPGDMAQGPTCGLVGQPCCAGVCGPDPAHPGATLVCYNRSDGSGKTVDPYCLVAPSQACGETNQPPCDLAGHIANRSPPNSPYGYCDNSAAGVQSIMGSACEPNANF